MPKCEKCGAQMATILKREGGKTKTVYECLECRRLEPGGPAPRPSGVGAVRCPSSAVW